MTDRWTPTLDEDSARDSDDIYITPENANQQLIELLRKVLPQNKFLSPEALVPIIVIGASLILSKFDFDREQILQTVQEVNGQIVTIYNQWVPLAMAFLYAVLGGGSLAYSAIVSRTKENSRQEAARSLRAHSRVLLEQERGRNAVVVNRNLELELKVQERKLEIAKVNNNLPDNPMHYNDVSEEFKSSE